ncbi:MAG: translation elongation factor 4 [Anaerolineae bacterium]|jgi:GTP-binding protein LepA|nr:translation elongation factor 4 [Anaerolineae bacterium]
MDQQQIRNFCIIAHIDHGKSTLADRMLQATHTISDREMMDQVLDTMDLEREKGVTIKASAVRMSYVAADGLAYQLNLIDTPGHVDFAYEVSRALQACEGALLVVDASQGVEAQTLANLYLAMEHDLEVVPVINKIDLVSAQPDAVADEIEEILGVQAEDVLRISAKEGTNVPSVLEQVVKQMPPPRGQRHQPLRALIFDSHYDPYKGVVAYVRVFDGSMETGQALRLMVTEQVLDPIEIGVFSPDMRATGRLEAGEVGYVATGLKTVVECRVGDTFTWQANPADVPLPGYRPMKPMVFASAYPSDAADYLALREALGKLELNDAALTFQPETSQALGYGFRCGFLGLFHMEIVQERLEREYDLDLVFTAPSVEYEVTLTDGSEIVIDSPVELPDPTQITEIREPWVQIDVFTPTEFIGQVMDLVTQRRGEFKAQEYLDQRRVLLSYHIPLIEILTDFYNELKARTRGYASLDYHFEGYRPADMVRMDVLVNKEPVDALSIIVHRDKMYNKGMRLVSKLKDVIPRQQFDVPIQAAVGNKVVSRANVKAIRKDVLAKCYGGDITRKRKLLEKQKAGKKRMKMIGSVEIPQEAFMTILKLDEE